MKPSYDAVVVGSGPNGLAAAITIARRGGSVLVLEAAPRIGGGMCTEELTLPGFRHDVCSAVHPMGINSPFLRTLSLEKEGLQWILPPAELAHPLDDGSAVLLERSVDGTSVGLGEDAQSYRDLMSPLVSHADALFDEVMRPMLHFPKHPLLLARFGLSALQPARKLAERKFRSPHARALFAGIAAHSTIPLSWKGSSATALMLMVAGHARGWPIPQGGSQSISAALASHLQTLGGELQTGFRVESLDQLPKSRWVFLDITPRQFLAIAGSRLTETQKHRLAHFRYGMGIFKLDFALSGAIPWKARECARAATVHLGGRLPEIDDSELAAELGQPCSKPFVLLAQPSLFDPSRAPPGQHTAWAYCHVPQGSAVDCTEAIENQIERFAPGFREKILARSVLSPAGLEQRNPNCIGGDISGGAMDLRQLVFRPYPAASPYRTPLPGVFLCSSSTPPGPGVHGMCGYWAARDAIG